MTKETELRVLSDAELDHVTGGAGEGLLGYEGQPGNQAGVGGGQPQSGQPGLTEGQNGPPPYP
jgi:hypothetical protein